MNLFVTILGSWNPDALQHFWESQCAAITTIVLFLPLSLSHTHACTHTHTYTHACTYTQFNYAATRTLCGSCVWQVVSAMKVQSQSLSSEMWTLSLWLQVGFRGLWFHRAMKFMCYDFIGQWNSCVYCYTFVVLWADKTSFGLPTCLWYCLRGSYTALSTLPFHIPVSVGLGVSVLGASVDSCSFRTPASMQGQLVAACWFLHHPPPYNFFKMYMVTPFHHLCDKGLVDEYPYNTGRHPSVCMGVSFLPTSATGTFK